MSSSSGAGDDYDLPIPRILIVLSNKGIDPTSVAKPWKAFVDQGYIVEFATEFGQVAKAEQRFLERSWFRQAMVRYITLEYYDSIGLNLITLDANLLISSGTYPQIGEDEMGY